MRASRSADAVTHLVTHEHEQGSLAARQSRPPTGAMREEATSREITHVARGPRGALEKTHGSIMARMTQPNEKEEAGLSFGYGYGLVLWGADTVE